MELAGCRCVRNNGRVHEAEPPPFDVLRKVDPRKIQMPPRRSGEIRRLACHWRAFLRARCPPPTVSSDEFGLGMQGVEAGSNVISTLSVYVVRVRVGGLAPILEPFASAFRCGYLVETRSSAVNSSTFTCTDLTGGVCTTATRTPCPLNSQHWIADLIPHTVIESSPCTVLHLAALAWPASWLAGWLADRTIATRATGKTLSLRASQAKIRAQNAFKEIAASRTASSLALQRSMALRKPRSLLMNLQCCSLSGGVLLSSLLCACFRADETKTPGGIGTRCCPRYKKTIPRTYPSSSVSKFVGIRGVFSRARALRRH
ncbi:hypothetical protein PHYSODRAFT_319564 [Phytophthora sojae]|uniref:Uncharacterized protein n=1 Tax=Phytophthora sojae (strain P6497) TaxID=1094619 RepID=G5AC15_PHYSP|nr:hypothetical protein PHYSODRAFT_319564 [Phytophthora sojae]EGZ06890.1 hypothetical protein PHYSODRAFT_319564 [Phytophthora sojae]|eukprot:XP_009537654.1 hypothetical protein PHYSODRAFT_319564 [Phytophthora sojae]